MILTVAFIVSFLDALSFSMVIMTTTPYVYSLGGTQSYLGILGSVSAAINLIWSPIAGSLSDSIGRKKVLLQCIGVALIGNWLVTCSSSLTVFFMSRIVTSFGTQIMVLMKALLDDNIKDTEKKMATMNKMQAIGGLCFIFGSLITGFMSEYENGYAYLFGIVTAMYGVNFVLISLIKTDESKKEEKEKQPFNIFKELRSAGYKLSNMNWPKYWDLFTLKLISDFSFGVFGFTFAPIVITGFGLSTKQFSYMFAVASIVSIALSLSLTKMKKMFYKNDKSGLKRLLHGCILLTYACIGQGLSSTFVLYFINMIPMSIVRVLFEATFTEVILGRASPEEKGSIMGTFETTVSIGGLTAPLLAGLVADAWGNQMCMLLCVIPLGLATILAYSQKRKID